MSLWTLLQACILVANAAAILNNERFLERRGWGFSQLGQQQDMASNGPSGLKHQIIGALHAIQYLRVPLIVVNLIVVFVKILFG